MPTVNEANCIAVLYAAAAADIGIIVRTNNVYNARAALYNARKLLPDPELATLSIRVSPDDSEHELWLLKNRRA